MRAEPASTAPTRAGAAESRDDMGRATGEFVPMRIVIVNKFLHITGGADRHCRGLAEILEKRGHEVAFLSTASSDPSSFPAVSVPASVTHDSRDDLSLTRQAKTAAKAWWNREAAAAMKQLLHDFRPDVVHAHKLYPQLSVAPVVEAARARIPIVQTLHDFELISASALDARGGWGDDDEIRLRYRLLNNSTFPVRKRVHVPRVRAFVSVSRYVARVYRAHGIASVVLPNFLTDTADGSGVQSTFADREGIVFVGRLQPEKGVADVVELARRRSDIPVTIAGAGDLDGYVAKHAEQLDNLTTAGFLGSEELFELMRHARLVVVPSRWQEPAGLTPIEAMAQGTPVVAYANGGLAEYVADAGGGRVVPTDVENLIETCAELYTDAETWAKLSRCALAAVEGTHSRGHYAEKIERVYESVV
jgi:glycosyltransferase involved in cell wall biosynthesis